jgi:hypothetical protein
MTVGGEGGGGGGGGGGRGPMTDVAADNTTRFFALLRAFLGLIFTFLLVRNDCTHVLT